VGDIIAAGFLGVFVTVLVTGGAGFIGANFVLDWLRNSDEPLVNVDKLTYAGNLHSIETALDNSRHRFIRADILDSDQMAAILLDHSPRAIVHFAAESHVDRSIAGPEEFARTNTSGTFLLLEEARKYVSNLEAAQRDAFRFINVSTDEVYGSLDASQTGFTESSPYAPNSPYSASKAAADHFARAYFQTYGLPVITTNCSNNFGPRQFPEKLIPRAIVSGLRGRPLPLFGDGQNVRDWLYVSDHCCALRTLLERGEPGQTYNIGGDSELSNVSVIEMVAAALDRSGPDNAGEALRRNVEFVADRPAHDRRYAINAGKIRGQTGWQPVQTFDSGLEKTVRWYVDNPAWIDAVENGDYREWTNEAMARRGQKE
jgi:dTDP-glucose 4,6-dehydratase